MTRPAVPASILVPLSCWTGEVAAEYARLNAIGRRMGSVHVMTIHLKTQNGWHTGRILTFSVAAMLAMSMASVAYAAPGSKLEQYRVPTAGSSPQHITAASDGNMWFTESFLYAQNVARHNVGRITPSGGVTEFAVCDFCFPNDIVQGSDGLLYYTRNDAPFGRVTTSGVALPVDPEDLFRFNGNGLDAPLVVTRPNGASFRV